MRVPLGALTQTDLDPAGNVVPRELCTPLDTNPWYCNLVWSSQKCRCFPVPQPSGAAVSPGLPAGYDPTTGAVDPANAAGATQSGADYGSSVIAGLPNVPPPSTPPPGPSGNSWLCTTFGWCGMSNTTVILGTALLTALLISMLQRR